MNKQIECDVLGPWYAIQTHIRQEERAAINLQMLGADVFNPKIREQRYNVYANTPMTIIKSLFPRYIFARFQLSELLHKVRYTRGVLNIVSFGGAPTPVEDQIIALIRSHINEEGYVVISEELQAGDQVVITEGPLKSFAGIFVRGMNDADRIRILLNTVSYQAHIEIPKLLVRKAH